MILRYGRRVGDRASARIIWLHFMGEQRRRNEGGKGGHLFRFLHFTHSINAPERELVCHDFFVDA